jgi:uroporphyrinogen-III synthase
VSLVDQLDTASGDLHQQLSRQRLIVPHARIHETARGLGFTQLTLTGSGDERLLAALQS